MEQFVDVKDNFRGMKSSAMFNDHQRALFQNISDRIETIGGQSVLKQFSGFCARNYAVARTRGGFLALIHFDDVIMAWQKLWRLLWPNHDDHPGDEEMALRSYLLFVSAKFRADGIFADEIPAVPKLDDLPEFTSSLDQALHQRYEKQCGFVICKVKRLLRDSKDVSRHDAVQWVDKLAPNVGEAGVFHHLIRTELYDIVRAFDAKAKLYFDVLNIHGNEIPHLLRKALLQDKDLKLVFIRILESIVHEAIPGNVIDLLYCLFLDASIRSILKFLFENAGLTRTVDNPQVPLRMRLNVSSGGKK